MNDIEQGLKNLGEAARREPAPAIDVRRSVLQTISLQRSRAPLDVVPLAFGGLAVVVAAIFLAMGLLSWQTMLDPWASYFVQVSQR